MPDPQDRELKIDIDVLQPGFLRVAMTFEDPNDDAAGAVAFGTTRFNPKEIPKLNNLSAFDYSAALSQMVFRADVPPGKESLEGFFAHKKGISAGGVLRVRVSIGATAETLNNLRWELLPDPADNRPLSTAGKFRFSRFVVNSRYSPVKVRRRSSLKALIAVANPTSYPSLTQPPAAIRKANEIARAKDAMAAFGADNIRVLGESESRADFVTLNALCDALRGDVDIVYLVCHGSVKAGPELFLQDETDGSCDFVSGLRLAEVIRSLSRPPRLFVLASCESAGAEGGLAETALAPVLADVGVPAIVAMQGKISLKTVSAFMPVFFKELLSSGSIDGAMTAARVAVATAVDAWVPALFLRLKSGSIWFDPGFVATLKKATETSANTADAVHPGFGVTGREDQDIWEQIRRAVNNKALVPVIGQDLAEHLIGSSSDIAAALADANGIFSSRLAKSDGARIAQAVQTKVGRQPLYSYLNAILDDRLKAAAVRLNPDLAALEDELALLGCIVEAITQDPEDPLNILAGLDAKIYVSAASDLFLKNVLRKHGKIPYEMCVDWRDETSNDFNGINSAAADLLTRFEESPNKAPEILISAWEDGIMEARYRRSVAGSTPTAIPISLRTIRDALLDRLDDNPTLPPLQVVRDWRESYLAPPIDHAYRPWPTQTPVIFYAYGKKTYPDSLVLTEGDFLDYFAKHSKFDLTPAIVTSIQLEDCVLFLGFSPDDLQFRILLRTLLLQHDRLRRFDIDYCFQFDPADTTREDSIRIQRQLQDDCHRRVVIYWGSSADFLRELKVRLGSYSPPIAYR